MGGQFPRNLNSSGFYIHRNLVQEMFGNTAAILGEIQCVWRKIISDRLA